ncbi:hypothetical protein ABZ318_32215 [Streptomyces sp. NPDC006197]|uniref:hypothetical protein n=1 Tax=Streptomyces sp. NPDC006197 TaxID=3156685 RepID=UPI0033ADE315
MNKHRYGDPCPLCHALLFLTVRQIPNGQFPFPNERVIGRSCSTCEAIRLQQWKEAMTTLYGFM